MMYTFIKIIFYALEFFGRVLLRMAVLLGLAAIAGLILLNPETTEFRHFMDFFQNQAVLVIAFGLAVITVFPVYLGVGRRPEKCAACQRGNCP